MKVKNLFFSKFLLTLILFFSSFSAQAQENINLLDVFYEALSKDSIGELVCNLTDQEFILDNYDSQRINPEAIIARYPDAAQYLIDDSLFLIKCDIDLAGKINGDMSKGDVQIEFENMIFQNLKIDINLYSPSKPNEIFYGSILSFENIKANDLSMQDCNFRLFFNNSNLRSLDLLMGLMSPVIYVNNSEIEVLSLFGIQSDVVRIQNNTINIMYIRGSEIKLDLIIKNNIFDPLKEEVMSVFIYADTEINNLYFQDNHFLSNEQYHEIVIRSFGATANISNNIFDGHVHLGNNTRTSFELQTNNFSTVCLMASLPQTPQNYVSIDWDDLSGKLVWKRNFGAYAQDSIYFGKTDKELGDEFNFNNLISSYSKLIEIFKNNRNTSDANKVYLEMKTIEENRHRYVYKTEGGSDNYFRLKLHQLLSVYTKHGTDPAQAISASVWLIFLFSIIYFFFPSDWDVKSKPQMIADFKTLVQKNEHGYFKPFLLLSQGIVISLFNALILSVNAFVTLGFGTIPTKGLAKYICILEGFLGWFLLSIFIVSLINQVLF